MVIVCAFFALNAIIPFITVEILIEASIMEYAVCGGIGQWAMHFICARCIFHWALAQPIANKHIMAPIYAVICTHTKAYTIHTINVA